MKKSTPFKIIVPNPTAEGRRVTARCSNPCCDNLVRPRLSDRKRGWGMYCSKSCKAIANPTVIIPQRDAAAQATQH
jgi:hypothetical protein